MNSIIKIFTSPNCVGCINAKKWFQNKNIDFIEKDFIRHSISRQDLIDILELTENGLEDIISQRSKKYEEIKLEIEDLKFNDMLDYILKNTSILKRPIMVQYVNNIPKRLLICYNTNDIEIFMRDNENKVHISKTECNFHSACKKKECSCHDNK